MDGKLALKFFESRDGGSTWANISLNLPNLPINCIEYQRGAKEALYLGTDIGIYYKDKTSTSWIRYDEGLPNVPVTDLDIQYSSKIIRASTFGRGVYEAPLVDPVDAQWKTYDCNGALNGTASIDACGTCTGGNTGLIANNCSLVSINKWNNITGTAVSAIPVTSTPDEKINLIGGVNKTFNEDNFGTQLKALFTAPKTDDYTFYFASDDNGELYIGTNSNETSKVKIAYVSNWTEPKVYDKYPSQKSSVIHLEEGKKYYFEILQKEGGGGAHFSLFLWKLLPSLRK